MQPCIQKVSPPFLLERKASSLTSTWVSRSTKPPFKAEGLSWAVTVAVSLQVEWFTSCHDSETFCIFWSCEETSVIYSKLEVVLLDTSWVVVPLALKPQLSSSSCISNCVTFQPQCAVSPLNLLVVLLSMGATTLHGKETRWSRHEFLLGPHWDISLWNTKEGNNLQMNEYHLVSCTKTLRGSCCYDPLSWPQACKLRT